MKKIRSHSTLPEGYQQAYALDLKEDKKLMILVNLYAFIPLIPFVVIYFWLIAPEMTYLEFNNWDFPHFILQMILMMIVHELIHGIFFKLGTKEKVRYQFHGIYASASVKGIYFYKHHYLVVGLAPFVILTIVYSLLLLIPGQFIFWYIILAMHTSACIGDFYVTLKLLKYPADTLIEDYGVGMVFYTKETS